MDPFTMLITGIVGIIGLVYGGDRALNSKKVQQILHKRKREKELEESDNQHTEDLHEALRQLVILDIQEKHHRRSIDTVYASIAEDPYRDLTESDYRYARDNYADVMQEVRKEVETQEREYDNDRRTQEQRRLRIDREKEMFDAVRKATADAIRQIENKPLDDLNHEFK